MNSNTIHTLNAGTELFIDDALIASKRGVTRTLHQCVKHDVPVLEPDPDNSWEHGGPRSVQTCSPLWDYVVRCSVRKISDVVHVSDGTALAV